MSRIIVKNLPQNGCTEELLNEIFSSKGNITDIKLKYKNGEFRRYAFVGFEEEGAAEEAINYFNGTFVKQHRIKLEHCTKETKKEAKAYGRKVLEDSKNNNTTSDKKEEPANIESPKKDNEEATDKKIADQKDVSDLDYLKSLKKKSTEIIKEKAKKERVFLHTVVIRLRQMCKGKKKGLTKPRLKEFIRPIKYKSLRIDHSHGGLNAFMGFATESLMKEALLKDGGFIDGARVSVHEHDRSKDTPKDASKAVAPWGAAEERIKGAESVADSGKIFIRNLWYSTTEDELRTFLQDYGEIVELDLPTNKHTRQNKGFATVTFMFPESAVRAMNELDASNFKGRIIHILPGMPHENKDGDEDKKGKKSGFQEEKEKKQKSTAGSWHNWNTLFLGPAALIDALQERTKLSKQQLLSDEGPTSVAVNLAIGEAAIVDEVKKTLEAEGVSLAAFSDPSVQRSSTILLAKNLPANTSSDKLQELFGRYGELGRVIVPPSGVTGIVEYLDVNEAKKGFRELAYSRFGSGMLYLEWAPIQVFAKEYDPSMKTKIKVKPDIKVEENKEKEDKPIKISTEPDATLHVKNINFKTSEDKLKEHFESEGDVCAVIIAMRRGLPQGYGFIQYYKQSSAKKALRTLQNSQLEGHNLVLKLSEKVLKTHVTSTRKIHEMNDRKSPKILCKNIPFQATSKEIRDLFEKFGNLKSVRLPLKVGLSEHRGFGFIEYTSPECAQMAFDALGGSTHLYGRRLNLDWAKEEESVDDIRKRTAEQFLATSSYKTNKRARLDMDAITKEVDE